MISDTIFSTNHPSLQKLREKYFFIFDREHNCIKEKSIFHAIYKGYHHCREVMADYYFIDKSPIIIGYRLESPNNPNASVENFNKFWEILEDKLKLKGADKSMIYRGSEKDFIFLDIGDFWRENETRRQFFTLFLRCGAEYYQGSFDEALRKYQLCNSILKTVLWFLDGNVVEKFSFDRPEMQYRMNTVGKYGLIHNYKDIEDATLKERLVKESENKEPNKELEKPVDSEANKP